MDSPRFRLAAALAAVYLIWGSTYLAIRFAIETIPPFLMGGTRFLVAGGTMCVVLRLSGAPRPTGRQWFGAFVVGLGVIGGWAPLAFALDWGRPPRQQNSTSAFYAHTDQWRYETVRIADLVSPTAPAGPWDGTLIDYNIRAERMGWLPSAPQLQTNPLHHTVFGLGLQIQRAVESVRVPAGEREARTELEMNV